MKTFHCVFTCLVLIAYVNSESQGDLLEALENIERLEAELAEETRSEGNKCIAKHHECTPDKDNCCSGKLFKYQCKCYDIEDDDGKKSPKCACVNSFHLKFTEIQRLDGKTLKTLAG